MEKVSDSKKEYSNCDVVVTKTGVNNSTFTNCRVRFEEDDSSSFTVCAVGGCAFNNCSFDTSFSYKIRFYECCIDGLTFKKCYLDGLQFIFCKFHNVLLDDVCIGKCFFKRCDFNEIRLFDFSLLHPLIEDCYFKECGFNSVCCCDCIVVNCDFDKTSCVFYSCEGLFVNHCPSVGSFVGWKKVRRVATNESCVVKLLIPADAKRCSAFGRKCRASKAKVLGIYKCGSEEPIEEGIAYSINDSKFKYCVGKTVKCEVEFDEDRLNECSSGIHFFMSRLEAEMYNIGYLGEDSWRTYDEIEKLKGLEK